MHPVQGPLTADLIFTAWRLDPITTGVVFVLLAAYWLAWRRSTVPIYRAIVFSVVGAAVWLLAGISVIGVFSDYLFWIRALQFVLLMLVAPFGLALGTPVTVVYQTLGDSGRARLDAALASRMARILLGPIVTSVLLLATPWVIYFSGWYEGLLRDEVVDVVTRLLLVAIGSVYFYVRLQLDPVPHRYPQALSLGITTIESIIDGLLGIVLWQGPTVAVGYYQGLARTWGPGLRTDQTIGAGILWILGDVVGLPFLMVLFRRFRTDERTREQIADAEVNDIETANPAYSGLWWEQDQNLRDRYR
ncbi:MAG: cytochrome c oxidase assembly protein [Gordonia sp. (in: high G+C Gram-positive bacteria)]